MSEMSKHNTGISLTTHNITAVSSSKKQSNRLTVKSQEFVGNFLKVGTTFCRLLIAIPLKMYSKFG